ALLDDDRRAPAAVVSALGQPDFFSCLLIECSQKGVLVGVAILYGEIINQDRAGGSAPGTFESAEVVRPQGATIDAVAVNSTATKERDDNLPIGDTTGRRPAVHHVTGLRTSFPSRLLPKQLAALAIDAKHQPLPALS